MGRLIVTLALAVLGGLLGFWFGRRQPDAPARAPEVETTIAEAPSVITALKDVARLEGAVFHVERVVDLTEKQSRLAGLVQAKDAILLVAAGDVVAGVDLGELVEADVVTEAGGQRITVTLPRARVFSQRLDSERTYVHSRQTDLLAQRKENLETRARQEAERTLGEAAVAGGILTRAEASVRSSVTALLRSLGFSDVVVHFRDRPSRDRPSRDEPSRDEPSRDEPSRDEPGAGPALQPGGPG